MLNKTGPSLATGQNSKSAQNRIGGELDCSSNSERLITRHDYTIGTLDVLQACDACAGMRMTYSVIVQCTDCVVFPITQTCASSWNLDTATLDNRSHRWHEHFPDVNYGLLVYIFAHTVFSTFCLTKFSVHYKLVLWGVFSRLLSLAVIVSTSD